MVPCDRRQRRGGMPSWNPLAPLLGLASRLAEGRLLGKEVQQRAAALGSAASSRVGGQGSSGGAVGSTSSPSGGPSGPAGSSAGGAAPAEQPADAGQQYCLEDVPVRRILAGGSPPQLAWVPLRVALAMLHDLPAHFMLLQGSLQQHKQQRPKQQQQQGAEARKAGKAAHRAQQGGASQQPAAFTTVTSPANLEVFVLPVSAHSCGLSELHCTCVCALLREWQWRHVGAASSRGPPRFQPRRGSPATAPPPVPALPLAAGPARAPAHARGRQHRVCASLPLRLPGALLCPGGVHAAARLLVNYCTAAAERCCMGSIPAHAQPGAAAWRRADPHLCALTAPLRPRPFLLRRPRRCCTTCGASAAAPCWPTAAWSAR